MIPFVGLKAGRHEFDFEVQDAFFDAFEYSIIKKGDLKVRLLFDKKEHMLVLDFLIGGTVELVCDRCLDPFDYPVETRQRQIVKISDETEEGEQEDVVFIGTREYEIDVAPFIYEFIHLALPMICVHPQNEAGEPACNPEVLAVLKKLKADGDTGEKKEGPGRSDPRWDALKKFRGN